MSTQSFSLIRPTELKELVEQNAPVVILDARHIDLFNEGHITGALHADWEACCEAAPPDSPPALKQPGYWGKLDAHKRTIELIRDLGINNDSRVVVYGDGLLSKGREGRIAWMLLYLGAENVSVLDGGWRAWTRCNFGATNNVENHLTRGSFTPVANESRRCYLNDVVKLISDNQHHDAVPLIDTRSHAEFCGTQYDYQPRMGHIPGAIALPYRSVLKANGEFISREEYLDSICKIESQIAFDESTIWYCEVGVRAAMVSLLHELYTGQITKVYDGSFMEWALQPDLPIAQG